jgi:putative spermidine/putrescine transport system permease protein
MAAFPPYITPLGRIWHYAFRIFCGAVLLFLIAPILVIIPLSFNMEPYFTYPIPGYSLRWYQDILNNDQWMLAIKNSILVGFFATIMATSLGTVAALGLSKQDLPFKSTIIGVLISPMIVPLVITGVGMYFFYVNFDLTQSLLGLVIAHTVLGTPFVVITVTATLVGFDKSLIQAAASLGATPVRTFFTVTLTLVLRRLVS